MSAPIDYDAVLGAGYVAALRAEFAKDIAYGYPSYLLGTLDGMTSASAVMTYGDAALDRVRAIIALFQECKK